MSTIRRVMVTDPVGRNVEARFHQFAGGERNRVVAIVEWDSGEVAKVSLKNIRFLKSEVPHEQAR